MEALRIQLDGSTTPPMLKIDGEIDLATTDELGAALDRALATAPDVVVDLEGVTFIGAAGVRVFITAAAALNGSGPLRFVNARRLAWLLDVTGLAKVDTIEFCDAA
jgi:anti-anti-sigma factor